MAQVAATCSTTPPRPLAILTGPARRRQRCPQQVFAWRHAARRDATTIPRETTSPAAVGFVPIITETAASEAWTAPIASLRPSPPARC